MSMQHFWLLSALIGSAGLLLWGQQQRINATESTAKAAGLETITARRDASAHLQNVEALKKILVQERDSQAALQLQQHQLRLGLSQREQHIKVLKDENALLRQWAYQPLPDVARRLRERPPFVGADAYAQWLSNRSALFPLSQPSPNER